MIDPKWFVRKVGFGLRPEEDIPADPLAWAFAQTDVLPLSVGIEDLTMSGTEIVPWPEEFQWSLEERVARFIEYWDGKEALDRDFDRNSAEYKAGIKELKKLLAQRYDELHRAHQCLYGSTPVFERLAHFWQNHFTVGSTGAEDWNGHYHQAAIKEKMLGSFPDLLYAALSHPAMMLYLDNHSSVGPDSEDAKWAKRNGKVAGLNENLAREILELHTLSPSGGYSQADIIGLAKVLTGWGYWPTSKDVKNVMSKDRWYLFFPNRHQPGRKKILGRTYGQGRATLRDVLDDLAIHPNTARFISTKLARSFIADEPSVAALDAIESAWKSSDGHLPTIHKAVIQEVANAGPKAKLIPPEPWLYQICRISGANLFPGFNNLEPEGSYERDPAELLEEAGQWYWSERQPNGFSDLSVDWTSAEYMDRRIRLSRLVSLAGRPTVSPESVIARCGLSKKVVKLIGRASSLHDQYTLLFCSKEFMGV
ncbi:uncharacterized protein METZ01_LOCUS160277 [marine metagenome]|uniref:DUF1800 domain-containing protein n=1 Tax=marine metagenome TaxID=408172 RepID=A0A382B2D3_9ZZZZ